MVQPPFTESIGVSAIVRLRATSALHEAGQVGMVVDQRPAGAHRYKVMFPGSPYPIWPHVEELEVLQGIDLNGWWKR